ncbi:response regulator [Paenibacillus sp. GCM10023248]|uniref:response regulator transcription factor n=1 Tax=Bacillales TaxID=1385 RepID=UPI002377F47D|nr:MULTISPECIES: response regulator [Bacillales]MDD9270517.1 response regulator [Paenibacillus sp. MAHUQ-63]MDR6884118.1 YesN/AraC family two-component response regulator [Bacillus sp. 3255]
MVMEANRLVKVIVVEDEDLIRNNLVKRIESGNHAVKVVGAAQDGKDALELVRQEQPDLLVTDIRMPVMDGLELIHILHMYFPRIRKIITSGYADFEYAKRAMQYNVNDYLLKPVSTDELQRVISRMITLIESERAQFEERLRGLSPHPAPNPEDTVQLVRDFMKENFTKELSLEHIARHFNFTASYLSKIFIKYTSEPPSRYLMMLRINEAKYLLTHHPNLTIKEVGESVGYPDQFYFSRIFKQITGFTPKEYQK